MSGLVRVSGVDLYPKTDSERVVQVAIAFEDEVSTRSVASIYSANLVNARAAYMRLVDFQVRQELLQPRQIDNALYYAAHPRPLTDLRQWPYTHQIDGLEAIISHPYFALFDEMGAGKTKQAIDAAQFLFFEGVIDRVVIIAPAAVRGVWFEPEFGELAKHLWLRTPSNVIEWHQRERSWKTLPKSSDRRLEWVITNFDFIRAKARLKQFLKFAGPKTLLIIDESAYVKNHKAQQTKACLVLRQACGRVLLLNGTPIAHSPLDMYSQGNLMDPRIHACQTYFQFRAHYAIIKRIDTGRVVFPKIIGWQHLDELQRRFAPFVLRRLKKDCLDLPEKLPPVNFSVNLTPETWSIYKEMRDQLCVWLDKNSVTAAAQAPVKAMRLSQILSGFIGGVEDPGVGGETEVPDWIDLLGSPDVPESSPADDAIAIRWLGTEKLDLYLEWVANRLDEDALFKLISWVKFKPELFRTVNALKTDKRFAGAIIGSLVGGQNKTDREASMKLLHPDTSPKNRPAIVVGTKGTGGVGTQMHAAHTVFCISDDFSYYKAKQSDDRVHRAGQTHAVSYYNCIAYGPDGQKTIDHLILKVREGRENIADLTTSAWIRHLRDE